MFVAVVNILFNFKYDERNFFPQIVPKYFTSCSSIFMCNRLTKVCTSATNIATILIKN